MSTPKVAVEPGRESETWRWYARRSPIPALVAQLELAEFVRVQVQDRHAAQALFQEATGGPFPLFDALACLGLARTAPYESDRVEAAERAKSVALKVRARLIAGHADDILAGRPEPDRPLAFC